MRRRPYTTMIVCITWDDVFTATLKVTNDAEIHTLLARIDRPLRHHIPNPDLNNIVFSLTAYGLVLDMASTFATLFGPTTENVELYIDYRRHRSGRTARLNYTE